MITMRLADTNGILYQWDAGQRVQIAGAEVGDRVDYAMSGETLSNYIYADGDLFYANIPNILLQNSGTIVIYVYHTDTDAGETTYSKAFRVVPRPKPDEYIYTETEVESYRALESRVTALEKSGGGGTATTIGEWELIGEVVSDGTGGVQGITIPVGFAKYRAVFVYAYNLQAKQILRIIARRSTAWYEGLFFGHNDQGYNMSNKWCIVGAAVDIGGQLYSAGATESGSNGGNAPWRSSYQTGGETNWEWSNFRYISLDTNNHGAVPEGCTLKVWGIRK